MMNRKPPPPLNPPTIRSVESLAADVASDAEVALGAARIAKRAAESMPKPDPREDVNYQRLSGLEQSFWARISPRRNRWPELREIDERLEQFDRRQEELRVTLIELRGRRERADAEYADELAVWMAAGEQEQKPVSEARALEEAIAEAEAEHAAIDTLRTGVLEERIAFVERHRKRLVRDAEREAEQARARYLEAVDMLAQAREDLIGLRETAVWASLYPSETLASMAPSHALVGGRRRESEQHLPGVKGELPAHAVLALLRSDAEYLATVSTVEQAAGMRGVTTAELTTREAMWAGSDADLARQNREKERLLATGGNTTVDALKLLEAQRAGTPPIGSQ
jgi:chromosome segregation protein